MTSTLRALSNLISAAVDEIEHVCATELFDFPSLDEQFTLDSEKARFHPDIVKSVSVIVGAASQLLATVREPSVSLINTACGFHLSSALQTVLVTNTVECLRPHGVKGLHIKHLASTTKIEENKLGDSELEDIVSLICGSNSVWLGRLLRLLCTFHIFREVRPDVFTNNRLSSILDTGKSVDELQCKHDSRHDGTLGLAALLEHFTDEIFKGSAYMTENLIDPLTSHSDSPRCTPLNRAFANDLDVFSWFELPENHSRLKRFGVAMHATERVNPVSAIRQGFPWATCASGDLVVDVGGGMGATTLDLYLAYPTLRYIIQDRPNVIAGTTKFWSNRAPLSLQSGQVLLQAHDFMESQPVKNAALFLLRKVLHDWSDTNAAIILHNLREAATPTTKLLIVDHIIPYACLDTSSNQHIPGAAVTVPPAPLMANMGQAAALAYITDIQMLVAFNAQERTLGQFVDLLRNSGWKLVQIYGPNKFAIKQLLAIPL